MKLDPSWFNFNILKNILTQFSRITLYLSLKLIVSLGRFFMNKWQLRILWSFEEIEVSGVMLGVVDSSWKIITYLHYGRATNIHIYIVFNPGSKWFENITYGFYDLLRNIPGLDLHRCQKNLGLREEFGKIEHLHRLEIGLESLHHQGPVVHERWSFLQKVHWLLVESKCQPENVKM